MEAPNETTEDVMDEQLDIDDILSLASEPNDDLLDILLGDDSDDEDEFIEWEEVYEEHFYGTLKSEIERIWESGKAVIFDVDVVGGINLKKHFRENALSIFVMPPSMKALEERLKGRGTDSPARIQKRLEKAKQELITADQFDYVVLNDELEKAVGAANLIVKKFLA